MWARDPLSIVYLCPIFLFLQELVSWCEHFTTFGICQWDWTIGEHGGRQKVRYKYRLKLVRWVLLVAVCVRSGKIMPIRIVRFIETVYAFIASFRTSYMWYVVTLLVVYHILLLVVLLLFDILSECYAVELCSSSAFPW